MTTSLLGMTVARSIPDAVLAGLAIGRYSLHGGVIRWATGTANAGQIVCHLLPVAQSLAPSMLTGAGIVAPAATVAAGAALTAAMPVMGAVAAGASVIGAVIGGVNLFTTFKVLKTVKQTMALAELNLAVTQNGFTDLNQRLDQLEARVAEVKDIASNILQLIKIEQRAELHVALENLSHLHMLTNPQVRIETLLSSAATLAKVSLIYEQRLAEADSLPEALLCEEYYVTAMLAQARCYGEMRELTRARHIIQTLHERWQPLVRQVMAKYLIMDRPERFLTSDFAANVPIAMLASWLDFFSCKTKGYDHIDELRLKLDPWYYYKNIEPDTPSRRVNRIQARDSILDYHRSHTIPALNKLVARNSILESYNAQYALLEEYHLTAQEFDSLISGVDPEALNEGMLILDTHRHDLSLAY